MNKFYTVIAAIIDTYGAVALALFQDAMSLVAVTGFVALAGVVLM